MDLQIPNTTNAIDGHIADLKNKLRNTLFERNQAIPDRLLSSIAHVRLTGYV